MFVSFSTIVRYHCNIREDNYIEGIWECVDMLSEKCMERITILKDIEHTSIPNKEVNDFKDIYTERLWEDVDPMWIGAYENDNYP